MKSQKGVTLISLTIYIIVMIIVVAIVSMITTYFYKNINGVTDSINPLTEYTKFNSFFAEEVNNKNIKILACEENYIAFDNDVQYTFITKNEGLYRNKVKICNDVKSCRFERKIKNGKNVISVTIQIGRNMAKNVEYTLNQ